MSGPRRPRGEPSPQVNRCGYCGESMCDGTIRHIPGCAYAGAPARSGPQRPARPPVPQYNPVILVADVMQLLGAKGIETSVGVQATTAKHAAADLLRALGVALGVAPVSAPVAPRRPQAGEVGR